MISEENSGFGERTEATLIKQAQAGCQESLNLLLLRHEGLVHLVDAVARDTGFGFDAFLHTVYTLPARRVVDLRLPPGILRF